MPEIVHFFYFVADDQEQLNKAWLAAKKRYGLEESSLSNFGGEGPVLSRLAAADSVSLSISILGHTAILQLSLHDTEPWKEMAGLEELRQELGDILLDCLTYQIRSEIDYYAMQHDAFVAQDAELNGRIGKILYRKEMEPAGLELNVEKTAEIFATMANYSVLLSNALRILRANLQHLEMLVRKGLHKRHDPYFTGRHGVRLKEFIGMLETSQYNFARSLDNAKAAIDVMKSRIDLANSRSTLGLQQQLGSLMRQNVIIQEEGLIMGIAATMVEFFVVLYYGLGVWKMLAGEEVVHHIPVLLKGGLIVVFSLAVVVGTHKAAKAIKNKNIKETLAGGIIILLLIAVMAAVSAFYAH
jgi:hypothetical protein